MKKGIVIIVALLFVFALASVSYALRGNVPLGAKDVETAKTAVKKVTGKVTAVDAAAKTITVKSKKAEVTATCDDKTAVIMGKEKKSLADVKVGDKVTVEYADVAGKNVAKSISIAPAKKAKGEPEGAKAISPVDIKFK